MSDPREGVVGTDLPTKLCVPMKRNYLTYRCNFQEQSRSYSQPSKG